MALRIIERFSGATIAEAVPCVGEVEVTLPSEIAESSQERKPLDMRVLYNNLQKTYAISGQLSLGNFIFEKNPKLESLHQVAYRVKMASRLAGIITLVSGVWASFSHKSFLAAFGTTILTTAAWCFAKQAHGIEERTNYKEASSLAVRLLVEKLANWRAQAIRDGQTDVVTWFENNPLPVLFRNKSPGDFFSGSEIKIFLQAFMKENRGRTGFMPKMEKWSLFLRNLPATHHFKTVHSDIWWAVDAEANTRAKYAELKSRMTLSFFQNMKVRLKAHLQEVDSRCPTPNPYFVTIALFHFDNDDGLGSSDSWQQELFSTIHQQFLECFKSLCDDPQRAKEIILTFPMNVPWGVRWVCEKIEDALLSKQKWDRLGERDDRVQDCQYELYCTWVRAKIKLFTNSSDFRF